MHYQLCEISWCRHLVKTGSASLFFQNSNDVIWDQRCMRVPIWLEPESTVPAGAHIAVRIHIVGAARFLCRGLKACGLAAPKLRTGLRYEPWRQLRHLRVGLKALLIEVAATEIFGLLVVQCAALAA